MGRGGKESSFALKKNCADITTYIQHRTYQNKTKKINNNLKY